MNRQPERLANSLVYSPGEEPQFEGKIFGLYAVMEYSLSFGRCIRNW